MRNRDESGDSWRNHKPTGLGFVSYEGRKKNQSSKHFRGGHVCCIRLLYKVVQHMLPKRNACDYPYCKAVKNEGMSQWQK